VTQASLDFRNTNSLWSSVLVETLVRAGVTQAVVSPGSRSAPLVFALARHSGLEAIPVLDERSAAFFALGLGRQHGRPVALVCTSGTAGANYLPAIVEAQEGGVPLLVITADRPPEMRACASGQTIDQQKLYGGHVNFFHELSVPEAAEPLLRYLRQTVAHAVGRTLAPVPGPVHLNAPFRDPLAPVADGLGEKLSSGVDWDNFFAQLEPPPPSVTVTKAPDLSWARRGLIVAGPAQSGDPRVYCLSLGKIARRLGWPVLADGLSPARQHASQIPHLVTTYDAILRQESAAEGLRPDAVLCLGGWPTSKVLRGWLEKGSHPTWLVSDHADNRDALHGRTRSLMLPFVALSVGPPAVAEAATDYADLWTGCERETRVALDLSLERESGLFEPKAAWLLARNLPEATPVFVASSMPVRDVEYVWPPGDRLARLFFNRGANGIDGTLSTALGVAHGGRPSVLLTGDLALLHDTNGFLLRPKLRGSLTVVLINNRGGGIFEHLPVAAFDPPFEEFFATPQEADFAQLCAAYGVGHVHVRDWAHFTGLISMLPPQGLRVLEIKTDRKRDAAQRKQLFADLAATL
jgi:2-succinyl-5-enolpyruvyl-6-hydroxy-3-cyclohexene-1-carboxylate synthase